MTTGPIHFKSADYVIAWDAKKAQHVYLKGADVVVQDNEITHVGTDWTGAADQVIDCAGRMLMPGMVNLHAHPSSTIEAKGLIEEVATIELSSSLLYDYYKLVNLDPEYKRANLTAAMAECLKGGSTTVVDISYVPSTGTYPAVDGWIETMAASGIRAYAGAQAASAVQYTPNGHTLAFRWAEDGGQAGLKEALNLVDQAERHESGRVGGILAAGQSETSTPELIRDIKREADARDMVVSIHASQAPVEFRVMIDRYGLSPVRWLDELGFLDHRTIIAHGLFMDDHPFIHWPKNLQQDRAIVAKRGATVAHCPYVQAKNGRIMRSFASYLSDGARVGLGTDCSPMSMLHEMRMATILCRVAEEWRLATTTADVFHAATIGGATALGREDLGRISVGAKADILSVDLSDPHMMPTRDPLRSLIFYANDTAIRDVWVDGRKVVSDGETVFIDHHAALQELQPGFDKLLGDVPAADHADRDADTAFPLSLEVQTP